MLMVRRPKEQKRKVRESLSGALALASVLLAIHLVVPPDALSGDLTSDAVDRFVSVLRDPAISSLQPTSSQSVASPPSSEGPAPRAQFSAFVTKLNGASLAALNSIATSHGFVDGADWASQGDDIATAYVCGQLMKERATTAEELRAETSAESKSKLGVFIKQLDGLIRQAGCSSISRSNLAVVSSRQQVLNDFFPLVVPRQPPPYGAK
jgi:hypothetical protein